MDYGALIQAVMGLVGELTAAGAREKARRLLEGSLDELGNLNIDNFERAVAQELGPSALDSIRSDPRLQRAQEQTIQNYDDIIESGGLDATDMSQLNAVGNESARRLAGNNSMLRQRFEASGQGGTGAAIQAQLVGQQQANDRVANAGIDQAAQAQQRRLAAIQARASEAGRQRDQGYNEQSRRAEATDSINRYNAGARTAANTYNNNLRQQKFDNEFRKSMAKAGLTTQVADSVNAGGQANAIALTNLGAATADTMRRANTYGPQSGGYGDPQPVYGGPTQYPASNPDEWTQYPNTRDRSVWEGW